MKKNKISKDWIRKQKKDQFFKKSKAQGYRSRSAYKLIEINNKFKFIKKNSYLLDLGSSPGGWSQVAAKIITNGKVLAADIKNMEKLEKVNFIAADIMDDKFDKKIKNDKKLPKSCYFLKMKTTTTHTISKCGVYAKKLMSVIFHCLIVQYQAGVWYLPLSGVWYVVSVW